MKGHASTWIEGDGTVRTVFRTMALWAYSSEEKANRQLMKGMVPKNDQSGPYTLQFAIDRTPGLRLISTRIMTLNFGI